MVTAVFITTTSAVGLPADSDRFQPPAETSPLLLLSYYRDVCDAAPGRGGRTFRLLSVVWHEHFETRRRLLIRSEQVVLVPSTPSDNWA